MTRTARGNLIMYVSKKSTKSKDVPILTNSREIFEIFFAELIARGDDVKNEEASEY